MIEEVDMIKARFYKKKLEQSYKTRCNSAQRLSKKKKKEENLSLSHALLLDDYP